VGRRLILDTGILIAAERGQLDLAKVVAAEDDVALAVITVTELRMGVRLAAARHASAREAAVARALAAFTIEEYTAAVTLHHVELLMRCRTTGATCGANDLMIAATARATSRALVTLDRRARFEDLPGVEVVAA
jgi:predicted nucleic acid-binding protein